jgi:hypothetical protein
MVEGCSGDNQSWRTVCLMGDDDVEALQAKVGLFSLLGSSVELELV